MSALLFKPDAATEENKVPAVVMSHGWWSDRKMQTANYLMFIDNAADQPLISAVLLVDNGPVYTDAVNENAYFNLYGARDVRLVADQCDGSFFRSYSSEGVAG